MARRVVIAGVGILVALTQSAGLRAQGPAQPAPAFEVASVKPSNPNPGSPLASIPLVRPPVNGRFSATNVPLRVLIRVAYEVQDFQIVGGPSWQLSAKYDITAKAPDGVADDMPGTMARLKTLLADRFKLKVHTETRDSPISALVLARSDGKLGPDMKPSTADCSNAQAEAQKRADALAKGGPAALASLMPKPGETIPCSVAPAIDPANPSAGFGLRGNGQPMATLTQLLSQATGRIVRDKTGLTGLYDWVLRFDPQILLQMASQVGLNLPTPGANAPSPFADSPSLLTALQEQLGLKLDSQRGPLDVVVIDSAEMPEPD